MLRHSPLTGKLTKSAGRRQRGRSTRWWGCGRFIMRYIAPINERHHSSVRAKISAAVRLAPSCTMTKLDMNVTAPLSFPNVTGSLLLFNHVIGARLSCAVNVGSRGGRYLHSRCLALVAITRQLSRSAEF